MSFATFAAQCRGAFIRAAAAGTALVVTHPRTLALCLAWVQFGEAGLSPLFDYTRACGATSFTGVHFVARKTSWHPVPFGR